MKMSWNIYATQAEGGIKGDGRVGIDWPQGDLTASEVHQVIDQLNAITRAMQGSRTHAPRVGALVVQRTK